MHAVCVCVCVCVPVAVSAGGQAALRLLLLLQLRLLFPFAMLCPGPAPPRGNYFNKFKPQRNNKQFVFRLKCNFHNFLYKAPHICPFFPNLPSPHCTLPPRPHSNAPAPARALNYYLLILFIRLPRALIFHKVFPTVQLFLLSLLLLLFPSVCVCVGRHLSCISQFTYSICVCVCVCACKCFIVIKSRAFSVIKRTFVSHLSGKFSSSIAATAPTNAPNKPNAAGTDA